MEFLKKIFKDEDTIIGLSGFKNMKPKQQRYFLKNQVYFTPSNSNPYFVTNFTENALL